MTHPRLRIALCALLLTVPFATVSAGGMFAAGDFYTSLNYDVAFAGERGVTVGTNEANLETDWGFLGAQLGIGFAISGFRPEFYGAYRRAPISGAALTKLSGKEIKADADENKALDKVTWGASSVSSLDLGLGVHYDIDTGTPFLPYLGVAGGASNVTVVLADEAHGATISQGVTLGSLGFEKTDSAWALGFQGNAGIGYAASDDIVITLGYRLTGTTEAELAKSTAKPKLKLALVHNGEVGLRYIF